MKTAETRQNASLKAVLSRACHLFMKNKTTYYAPKGESFSDLIKARHGLPPLKSVTFVELFPGFVAGQDQEPLIIQAYDFEQLDLTTIPYQAKLCVNNFIRLGIQFNIRKIGGTIVLTMVHLRILSKSEKHDAILKAARKLSMPRPDETKTGFSFAIFMRAETGIGERFKYVDERYSLILREARIKAVALLEALTHPFQSPEVPLNRKFEDPHSLFQHSPAA